jgi:putative transposase
MTQRKDSATAADWREILGSGPDGLRQLVQQIVQEVLDAEMDETVGARRVSGRPSGWGIDPGTTRGRW